MLKKNLFIGIIKKNLILIKALILVIILSNCARTDDQDNDQETDIKTNKKVGGSTGISDPPEPGGGSGGGSITSKSKTDLDNLLDPKKPNAIKNKNKQKPNSLTLKSDNKTKINNKNNKDKVPSSNKLNNTTNKIPNNKNGDPAIKTPNEINIKNPNNTLPNKPASSQSIPNSSPIVNTPINSELQTNIPIENDEEPISQGVKSKQKYIPTWKKILKPLCYIVGGIGLIKGSIWGYNKYYSSADINNDNILLDQSNNIIDSSNAFHYQSYNEDYALKGNFSENLGFVNSNNEIEVYDNVNQIINSNNTQNENIDIIKDNQESIIVNDKSQDNSYFSYMSSTFNYFKSFIFSDNSNDITSSNIEDNPLHNDDSINIKSTIEDLAQFTTQMNHTTDNIVLENPIDNPIKEDDLFNDDINNGNEEDKSFINKDDEPSLDDNKPSIINDDEEPSLNDEKPSIINDEEELSLDNEKPSIINDDEELSLDNEKPSIINDDEELSLDDEEPSIINDDEELSLDDEKPSIINEDDDMYQELGDENEYYFDDDDYRIPN